MGSTMTFSPEDVYRMKSFVFLYCSATKGEMLDLKPPVPRPIMTRATMKQAREPLECSMTPGTEEMTRRKCPKRATATDTQTVL